MCICAKNFADFGAMNKVSNGDLFLFFLFLFLFFFFDDYDSDV